MLWWIFQQSVPCLNEYLRSFRWLCFMFFFWLRVFNIVSWCFFRPRLNILVFPFKTRKINLISSAFPLRIEEAIVSNQFLHPATSLVGSTWLHTFSFNFNLLPPFYLLAQQSRWSFRSQYYHDKTQFYDTKRIYFMTIWSTKSNKSSGKLLLEFYVCFFLCSQVFCNKAFFRVYIYSYIWYWFVLYFENLRI